MVARQVKGGFHHTAICPELDAFGVCPLSEQQANGTQYNRFTCTRLTSYHRKARMQVYIQMLNERIVFYVKCLNQDCILRVEKL